MRGLIFIVMCTLLFSGVKAQEQVARYEQEKKDNGEYFTVISGGDLGLLLVREDNSERGRDNKWVLTKLNTDLVEDWTKALTVESRYEFRAYERSGGDMYIVFVESERIVSEYLILQVNLESGRILPFTVKNQLAFELTNIIAIQDRVILAGFVRDSPTILSYKAGESKFDVVPGYFTAKSDIIDLSMNMDGLTYNIVTMERSYTGYFLRIRTYSYDSDILFERELRMRDNLQIIDGITLGFVDGNIAIAGSYGSQSSNFIQGIYFAIIRPAGQDNLVKYHDFGELQHFFDYTNPRRAEKLEERATEMAERGKDMKLSLRLLLKNMISVGDEFILFAEVYDQKYNRSNSYYNSPYGYMPMSRYSMLYDPFLYRYYRDPTRGGFAQDQTPTFELLESVVIGISKEGDVRWDNTLVVEDSDNESGISLVDAFASREFVHMLYKFEEELVYKSIPYNSVPVEETTVPLKLEGAEEDVRNDYEDVGGVQFWHNNAFYVWGFNRIAGPEGKRNVIFINKVIF